MIHPSLESSLARTGSEGTAAEGSRPCSASRSSISANCVAVRLPTIFCVMLRWQPMASMVQRQPRSPSCWQRRNGDDLVRLVGCPSTRRWRAVPPFLAQHRIHRGLLGTSVCLALAEACFGVKFHRYWICKLPLDHSFFDSVNCHGASDLYRFQS